MNKTKIIKTFFTCLVSLLMVPAVLLTSTHAKDLATYRVGKVKSPHVAINDLMPKKSHDDPMAKSLGELHNHVDNTMVKNLGKSSADQATMQARRKAEALMDAKPLHEVWFEIVMLFRFSVACAFAR